MGKAEQSAAARSAGAPRPLRPGDHVFLVDGSSYIFRAYFAMFKAAQARGRSFTRSDGLPIGAVLTFCNMLFKMLREGLNGVKPTHIAVVFDHSAKSFRNEIYADYKGHRPEPPDELIPQFPLMREAVRAFGLIPIEQEGYEADDLIATYARAALEAKADVTIVAGDKDLMQLVRPGITMYDPMPGNERRIGREEVIERFGVPPEKVPDVQALIGDSTDNVPGVPGIGVKTAAQLINEFGDLETLLARAGEIKQQKRRESLIAFAEQARLSKRLVLLDDHVPLEYPIERLGLDGASCLAGGDARPLIAFLKAMEFNALTKRVAEATGIDPDTVKPDPRLAAKGIDAGSEEMTAENAVEGEASPAPAEATGAGGPRAGERAAAGVPPAPSPKASGRVGTPSALALARQAAAKAAGFDPARYHTITMISVLDDWIAEASNRGVMALGIEATSAD
ncbi:MAG: DNA polymerase I, partial [Dehalococcoidia bacterium]|nr:DNA polymerase I [Dehalococcoidia bacterium]